MAAAAAGTAVGAMAGCGSRRGGEGADIIFTGGPVVTVVPGMAEAQALAVTGGRISAVGASAEVLTLRRPDTRVVDLRGRALLPAFVEPHGHPFEMATTLGPPAIDVRPFTVATGAQVLQKLTDATTTTPAGTPILMYGLDLLLQPGLQLPTRTQLDALAPNNPVVIIADNGHAAYGNTAAFTLAGIGKDTPDPVGAHFVHGPDGELTGEVHEAAAILALTAPFQTAAAAHTLDNVRWAYAQPAQAGYATSASTPTTPAVRPRC